MLQELKEIVTQNNNQNNDDDKDTDDNKDDKDADNYKDNNDGILALGVDSHGYQAQELSQLFHGT